MTFGFLMWPEDHKTSFKDLITREVYGYDIKARSFGEVLPSLNTCQTKIHIFGEHPSF